MIKSMTGFGRSEYRNSGREYTVEIKTVNHRYYDVNVKLPKQYSFLEDTVRKIASNFISRGKADIFISIDTFESDNKQIVFNEKLISFYSEEAKELQKKYGIINDMSFSNLLSLPDIMKINTDDSEDEMVNEISIATKTALEELMNMRSKEGEALKKDLEDKINGIGEIFKNIEERSKHVPEEYKEKLKAKITEITTGMDIADESRIATEIAIFADRSCIDEEITRFFSHIKQFNDTLCMNIAVGKKLDFIVQEMNREINTIGSKASDLTITKNVIELKNRLEQVREQIQNVE